MHHQGERDNRAIATRPDDAGNAEFVDMLAVGHLALGGVERLVLKEDDRIVIAHRRRQQPLDVGRR